jgi:predicted RNA binding protein YcfA (HicA-like mRNA interferase family)
MPKIPPMKYREVVKKLRKLGFGFRRATGGTHEVWWNEKTKKTCVVPHHHEVKSGTMRSIIRQAGLTEEELLKS